MKEIREPGPELNNHVIVAQESLQDPNFHKSIIFIAEHDAKGTMGFILNRPTGKTISDVVESNEITDVMGSLPVYFGGPVQAESMHISIFKKTEHKIEAQLSPNFIEISQALTQPDMWVKAFMGYTGWGEGQIQFELDQDAWKIQEADSLLFELKQHDGLWNALIQDDQRWRKMIDFLPSDPGLN